MGIGASEILVIIFVVVLLFGGGRIGEIGRGLGEGIRSFKRGLQGKPEPPPTPAVEPADTPTVAAELHATAPPRPDPATTDPTVVPADPHTEARRA